MGDDPPDRIVVHRSTCERWVRQRTSTSPIRPRAHRIGLVALDLAAVAAANDETCRLLADPQLDRSEKREAVTTALLIERLRNRPLYPCGALPAAPTMRRAGRSRRLRQQPAPGG
jgi:hypothetical protein